jgi:hypothetical protein
MLVCAIAACVMEVADENDAHRDSFLRADRSDNSWQYQRKSGEFGNYQSSLLLRSSFVSAALS